MTSTTSCLEDEFDTSVQAYTLCQKCNSIDWCVSDDNGKELCRSCYVNER